MVVELWWDWFGLVCVMVLCEMGGRERMYCLRWAALMSMDVLLGLEMGVLV